MTLKSFLIAGTLTLSTIAIAGAKSYSFTLDNATQAGSTELKAGDYVVKVSGDEAVFTNADGKSFAVPATVAQSDKKFGETAVDTSHQDKVTRINEIDLGGSTTKLTFGQ